MDDERDVLILDLVIVGRGWTPGWETRHRVDLHRLDVLYALVVRWEDDVAYRLGYLSIFESNWIRLKNRRWRLVTLG